MTHPCNAYHAEPLSGEKRDGPVSGNKRRSARQLNTKSEGVDSLNGTTIR